MSAVESIWLSKEVIAAGLQAAATLLAVIGTAWYAVRQLRRQAASDLGQDLRRRQADALQAAWGLLQQLSSVDNGQNMLVYIHTKAAPGAQAAGSGDTKQYFLRVPAAQAFVFEHLPRAFYAQGAGIHWPVAVRDSFFECRTIVYGVLLAERVAHPAPTAAASTPVPDIAFRKPEAAARLEALYAQINADLRTEMARIYAQPARIEAGK
jgi:hypothetical protein